MTASGNDRGRIGRRQFLGKALAGTAAAAALPNIISASAWASPPSNRLTLGFIGLGKMMGGHVPFYLNRKDCQALAVCDVEANRLETYRANVDNHYANAHGQGSYQACAAYGDFRDLVARDDIDAVVIATPDHWHAIPSIRAMESGKDVYCEKPLCLTIDEGKAMVAAARRYGRVFQTGSQQRSAPEFRLACELVRNGRIGKVHTVRVNVGGPPVECYLPAQPVPEGLDWDMWLGPSPWRPYHYDLAPPPDYPGWPDFRAYRDFAGGGMTDFGAHHFDIAQWGLGMDESGPVEIYPPDGKDYHRLTYKYANGIVMEHGGAESQAAVEFIGETGRVMVNRGYLATDPAHLQFEPIGPDDIRLHPSGSHQENWLDCVRSRKKPICDVAIGCRSATVCHLGNIAYWVKRPFRWNPETEQIEGDDTARRQISRPMRGPWSL